VRDHYTRHDVEAAANDAILAADGQMTRDLARQVARAVLNSYGLTYRVTDYRPGEVCPKCRGKNWHVGRHTAECGPCGYVLPLAHA